ncbi:MAG: hypothetical protein GY835_13880 [bacterium]|nr:hypothetical protein [bacterium]
MMPTSTKRLWIAFVIFLLMGITFGVGTMVGIALSEKRIVISLKSADNRFEAIVRSGFTFDPPKHSLWLRNVASGEQRLLAHLREGLDSCDVVVWSENGDRVAFLLGFTRLLVYESAGGQQIFEGELVDAAQQAEGMCVRGLEFLPGGDGVRFGITYRDRAGRVSLSSIAF